MADDDTREVKLRREAGSGLPLLSKVSPTAETEPAVVVCTSWPDPLTFRVLPPGLAAVPRSTVPPVTETAGAVAVADACTMASFRKVRLPPVTRMVGASVAVLKVMLLMTTSPPVTVKAGEWPS